MKTFNLFKSFFNKRKINDWPSLLISLTKETDSPVNLKDFIKLFTDARTNLLYDKFSFTNLADGDFTSKIKGFKEMSIELILQSRTDIVKYFMAEYPHPLLREDKSYMALYQKIKNLSADLNGFFNQMYIDFAKSNADFVVEYTNKKIQILSELIYDSKANRTMKFLNQDFDFDMKLIHKIVRLLRSNRGTQILTSEFLLDVTSWIDAPDRFVLI